MAQIPGTGFVMERFRGSRGFLLSLGFTFAAVLFLLSPPKAQAQGAPTSDVGRKNTPTASAASPVTPQEVATPPAPPTVEQAPPQPPAVAWDGKQLTIEADNATLSAILVAVRERTGASIEIPPGASGERVFVHLGPGPARDIISSLVYGMPFDYVIETAEDDPDTLRSVVLTARGQGDSSSDVVVAGATNAGEGSGGGGSTLPATAHRGGVTDSQARPEGMRMMPGWAAPGKPSFQADAEAALAAEQAAAQESAATQESAAAPESAGTQDSARAQDAPGAQDSPAAADMPEATKASNSSPSASDSTSDSNDPSGVGQAIHNMTRMFEQRRQIQAKQNQPPPPPSN